MDDAKLDPEDLDFPRQVLSNGGLGIVVHSPSGSSGNQFFVCFYWGPIKL